MSVKSNFVGTTQEKFQIGLDGPTIYQGIGPPSPIIGVDGDLFIANGSSPSTFQKLSGAWVPIGTNFSFNEISTLIRVPIGQQMVVFGELQLEIGGELQIEGSVVLEV